jgi:chromosome segregation ATPase
VEALRAEQQVLRDQIASLAEGSTGLDPVLARLESTLGVGGEATLEVGRRVGALESSLAALSDADADLPRRLDEVVERLERLDAMVRHDLLGRQATLLERSLAVSATLESEWSRFRERALEAESARAAAEHARRRCEAERDEALASAARALGEREAAVRNRVVAVAAFEDVQRELARCREQVATTRGAARAAIAERDRIAEEKDRTSQALLSVTSSRSWKLTRPLRALGRAFRQALAWTAE